MSRLLPLAFTLLSTAAVADVVTPGFESVLAPYPVGARIHFLSDGTSVTSDGVSVQHWNAGGGLINTLGTFAAPGQTGAFVVDPSETFVLAGVADTGELLKVDLQGAGATSLGTLLWNADAAFDSPTTAIVSAGTCGTDCGNALLRLDVSTGSVTFIAAVEGIAGPVALDNAGDLYYGTQSAALPVPAGSSSLLRYTSAQLASMPSPAFQPDRELVVVEVESVPPATNWTPSTLLPGFTGTSYYRWDGPDLYTSPGSGILLYDFEIEVAGNYLFYIHNRHEDPQPDLENDVWVRVDGGSWDKVYSNYGTASVGVWNWYSYVDPSSGSDYQANYTLSAGRHTLEFSGRSNGFNIDRFVFVGNTPRDPFDPTNPESIRAPYNASHAATVASGFDGATELIHDAVLDHLILAENNAATGTNRIRTISPAGGVGTLVTGDAFNTIRDLDLTPGPGPAVFFPYQPNGAAWLGYTREGATVSEHRALTPDRPTLVVSGPGAPSGLGLVTIDVLDAVPTGFVLLAYGLASGVSVTELPIYFGGLPLIHTPLPFGSTSIVPFPLACDGNGDASLSFVNTIGVPGALGVQALVLDGSGNLVGSSTTGLL
jgi:hypothetical protein